MLHHKFQNLNQKDSQSFAIAYNKLTHYIVLLHKSYKAATTTNMEKKKGNSTSYLLALGFILALTFPTLLSASRFYAIKDHLFPEFIKWHVSVVNSLNYNQILFTHCKSSEDDVGINNLSPGSNITWSFRTDFFHSTMFWCYVTKDSASLKFEAFRYDERLFNKCDWKNCIWVAKDDGVYLKNLSQRLDELVYKWDTGM
ncbi:putative plant self-incompatibility S1 [Medicago truncatula]|uniref:S-protein homolog n=2 Tax=Medicago truncatula TaxID=3880 RepID=A0A396JR47_MEDTR|nr:S-protein homolog 1 [Medicago truncatula]RHN79952.1 putative plant self-incompatibility S1 [Medicago truncatula]